MLFIKKKTSVCLAVWQVKIKRGSFFKLFLNWFVRRALTKSATAPSPWNPNIFAFSRRRPCTHGTAQGLRKLASYIVLNAIIVQPKARSRHATAHNWHERFDTWVKLLNLLEAAINCRMIGCHIDTTHTDTCYVYVLVRINLCHVGLEFVKSSVQYSCVVPQVQSFSFKKVSAKQCCRLGVSLHITISPICSTCEPVKQIDKPNQPCSSACHFHAASPDNSTFFQSFNACCQVMLYWEFSIQPCSKPIKKSFLAAAFHGSCLSSTLWINLSISTNVGASWFQP